MRKIGDAKDDMYQEPRVRNASATTADGPLAAPPAPVAPGLRRLRNSAEKSLEGPARPRAPEGQGGLEGTVLLRGGNFSSLQATVMVRRRGGDDEESISKTKFVVR